MYCPTCQTPNDAMSLRCFQCNTTLFTREEDRSPETKRVTRNYDSKIYVGIGSWLALTIGWLVFRSAGAAIFFGFIGGIVGKVIANKKSKGL